MEFNEEEASKYLGGAPETVVTKFQKPGELSEYDLDGVMAGPNRVAIVEKELSSNNLYRDSSIQREKDAMFAELDAKEHPSNTNSNLTR